MNHNTIIGIVMAFVCYGVVSIGCLVAVEIMPEYRRLGWVWYVTVQVVMFAFMVLGWFVLLPYCLAQTWTKSTLSGSIKDGRPIDYWNAGWLRAIYGNPEDGVSGQYALVTQQDGSQGPYLPNAPAWWRAYCWSAWRNSCDGLKYVFAWSNGPQAQWRGHKLGWWDENGYKVPVL